MLAIPCGDVRRDLTLGDVARERADLALFGCRLEFAGWRRG